MKTCTHILLVQANKRVNSYFWAPNFHLKQSFSYTKLCKAQEYVTIFSANIVSSKNIFYKNALKM